MLSILERLALAFGYRVGITDDDELPPEANIEAGIGRS